MAKILAFPKPQRDALRVGGLGSTRGTAMQVILDALAKDQLPDVALALVISDKPDAPILDRATSADIDPDRVKFLRTVRIVRRLSDPAAFSP